MERDDNFSKLIDITGEILQGIINERVAGLLDENIAFVTFGSWTAVRQHLTNDESLWIEGLDAIRDSGLDGPAILCQGLRLCKTAIHGNQNPMEIDNLCISPRIILITDGNISSLSHPSDSFQSRESDRQQIYNLVVDMASKNYSVFCVPLCHRNSPRYRFLEKIAHLGSGSIIRPDELQFIARYYRKIVSALLFGSWHLHVSKRSFIEKCLKESKGVTSFTDDEVEDMMEIVTNPDILGYLRASPKDGKYQESYEDLPPLGTRIKQGEHWREDVFYEHHCGPGTGTVVGQEDGSVYVEWDGFEDGIHYLYKYGLNEIYEVRVHDRPRTPEEGKAFLVGCCITRIEWEEDEHEDPLGYGLVFVSSPQFKAFGVRWKNGDLSYYKYDDLLCCVQEELLISSTTIVKLGTSLWKFNLLRHVNNIGSGYRNSVSTIGKFSIEKLKLSPLPHRLIKSGPKGSD
ncbi:uncharacterized protein LOC132550451 [Ylistrum balloti]|uniref:uncharacterized protein LOC132550451 n=1 Tax=Ylistrum balloti TaxID=509963 RepID=UPI002905D1AA|nr:uncharacterized protein LOC132550451 [Ylistrum balloti]